MGEPGALPTSPLKRSPMSANGPEERRVLTADLGGNASTSQMGDEAARLVREGRGLFRSCCKARLSRHSLLPSG